MPTREDLSVSYRVSFDQAEKQRLTDPSGAPFWIEISRGERPSTEIPMFNGFTQAAWSAQQAGRHLLWLLRPGEQPWKVELFLADDGHKNYPAEKLLVVPSRREAIDVAEQWRLERT